MNISESWGYRADACVACLMGALAFALGICGCVAAYHSKCVMPYLALFPVVEMIWWTWIGHTLWLRWKHGHFSHAAWHVAIALPLALLTVVSCLSYAPHLPVSAMSPFWPERLFQQVFLSLVWWWQQI